MGFLQDAEAIAKRSGATEISLLDLETLRDKYDMDADTFRQLRRLATRGKVALKALHGYFDDFSAPLFEKRVRRLVQTR